MERKGKSTNTMIAVFTMRMYMAIMNSPFLEVVNEINHNIQKHGQSTTTKDLVTNASVGTLPSHTTNNLQYIIYSIHLYEAPTLQPQLLAVLYLQPFIMLVIVLTLLLRLHDGL